MGRLDRLRERAAEWIGGREYTQEIGKLKRTTEVLLDLRHYEISRQSADRLLSELDSHYVDLLYRMRGYRVLGRLGGQEFTEWDRLEMVQESRYMYMYDVLIRRATQMWTDFGFGQHIDVSSRDPLADGVLDEFWNAPRNAPVLKQRRLQRNSNTVLTDGEIFYAIYSATDGTATIRIIPSDEITEIIYDNEDVDVPLYYVRSMELGGEYVNLYYPDWRADPKALDAYEIPQGAQRADDVKTGTGVVIVHAAINEYNGRGWPQFWQSFDWARAYRSFLGDRATIAKAVATYVDEVIVDSGSRGIEAVRSKFASSLTTGDDTWYDTNPPSATGSVAVHNKAVEMVRRPLTTGASDAQIDGLTLLGQVSAGTGVPSHWLGRPDAMQNRATARETELPWLEQMERYQMFWADVFADICEVVLRLREQAGVKFGDDAYPVDVTMELPLTAQAAEITQFYNAVNQSAGVALEMDTATRALDTLLQLQLINFGVKGVQDIVEPESTQPTPEPDAVDTRIASADVAEAHVPVQVSHVCPMCGHPTAQQYDGHGAWLLCEGCWKSYNTLVENAPVECGC